MLDAEGTQRAAGQLARRIASQAIRRAASSAAKALLAWLGPTGLLVVLVLLAVIALWYGVPQAARGSATDPASSQARQLWQQSQAAAAAATPPSRSVDGAERNWMVDAGWLAALDVSATVSGRPMRLRDWAAALAPRFTYRASTTTVTRTVVTGGKSQRVTTTTEESVTLLVMADTAVGKATRTYAWTTDTRTDPDGSTVTVRHEVPVSTAWAPDTSRLAAVAARALGRTMDAGNLAAFQALATAWDDPDSGLLALMGPVLSGAARPGGDLVQAVLAWRPLILPAAAAAGIDPALVEAVVGAESGGDPNSPSSAGAEGLMQLEPGTAHALGVYDLFDPASNIRAGVAHLAWLLGEYGFGPSCWPQGGQPVSPPCALPLAKTIAAYNAGEGPVAQYGGVPPYPETQQYVRMVLSYYAAFRGAAQ